MSEHQRYEFITLDGVLTVSQQRALRAISSRASITATSFENTYEWGDLKAQPLLLVRRYFDLGVHVANFGIRRLMIRVPRAAVEVAQLKAYSGSVVKLHAWGKTVGIDISPSFEAGDFDDDDTIEGGGLLAGLSLVRSAILLGDMTPLYCAWLVGVQLGEEDEDALEPPVPSGLATSAAAASISSFLALDRRLFMAAAKNSVAPKRKTEVRRAIKAMKLTEKDAALFDLVSGEAGAARRRVLKGIAPIAERSSQAKRRRIGELRGAMG